MQGCDIQHNLKRAVAFHQGGEIEAARQLYLRILAIEPDNAQALHLMGVAAYQQGRCDAAINLIEKAIERDDTCADYHNNLGNACLEAGRAGEAAGHYRHAIRLQPDYGEAHFGLGNACYQNGDHQEALSSYATAVALSPGFAEAHNNMGIVLGASGQTGRAISAFQNALLANPVYMDALHNLADALTRSGDYGQAVAAYEKILQMAPESARIHAAMGNARHAQKNFSEAIRCYRRALAIAPDLPSAHNDLGTVHMDLGQLDAARRCYRQCLRLQPDHAGACNNLGILCKLSGKYDEAVRWYRQAIRLKPDFADAYYNLGHVFGRQKQILPAISCYRKTLSLRPDHIRAHAYLIRQLQHGCMWADLADAVRQLRSLTDEPIGKGVNAGVMPFLAFSISDDPRYNLAVSRSWCRRAFSHFQPVRGPEQDRTDAGGHSDDRICIGYLSGDFKNHATAHLMASLFQTHDRSGFKIHAYSYGIDDRSDYRRRIETGCDRFVDIRALTHRDAALRIARDGVDILVELKGHTEGNRMEICAYRPAPIQVAYLGFPGSSGADFMDYMISDAVVTPPGHAAWFTEKLVMLPHSYQVNDRLQKISAAPVSRRDAGLPDAGCVFCSFNEPYKIEPALFDVWMSILRQVPDSVMWLLETADVTGGELRERARKCGIASNRLVFARKISKKRHLARLRLADLALDTRTVNGHTTTSDALWAGVPVISMLGTHFASRVSASLLHAVGLGDLVAESTAAYETLAVTLAADPEKLGRLKGRLEKNRIRMPLFDTGRFTRNLERAYRFIWRRHMCGQPPISFNAGDAGRPD